MRWPIALPTWLRDAYAAPCPRCGVDVAATVSMLGTVALAACPSGCRLIGEERRALVAEVRRQRTASEAW